VGAQHFKRMLAIYGRNKLITPLHHGAFQNHAGKQIIFSYKDREGSHIYQSFIGCTLTKPTD
jgi:hypothetical protein